MHYRIYLDSDHHQMDTSARSMVGEHEVYDEAVRAACALVDEILADAHVPGMSATELLRAYAARDEIPFIIPDEAEPPFDAREYAARRCEEICSG